MDAPLRVEGSCDPRFERVREAFVRNFVEHGEIGAGVAVTIGGRDVVDLWGGYADEARTRPWQRDTLVNVFSVSKGVLAIAMLVLMDRGLVVPDERVSHYWPEFAAAGKENVTVRQLLSHRAGLPALREVLPDGAMYDWNAMTGRLAREKPWWEPGTRHGYHVNTFGFLVGEVMRRVSGVSVGEFLRREIAAPLDADFMVGVRPADDARVADFVWNPALTDVPVVDRTMISEEQLMEYHTYFNPRGASGHDTVNTTEWRRAEYPSTNGHGTALGVARAYGVIASGGTVGGRRYVSAELVREASREHSAGEDAVLHRPSRFGLGFQLSPREKPIGPNEGVVLHFGAGGALGFADPVAGIGFGYAMNKMGDRYANPTNRGLINAVYACL